MEEALLVDPFPFIDDDPVHYRDLPSRSTEAVDAHVSPGLRGLFQGDLRT